MAQSRLLIVGDAALRAGLMEQFAHESGFAALQASTLDEASRLLVEGIEILLVDDALPSAGAFVADARAADYAGAVVLLTASDDESPPGVDACVARPFRFAQLLALLRAVLAARTAKTRVVAIGPYLFSVATQALTAADGARIMLTEKEAATLARLSRSADAVARDVLLADVWGYSPTVTTRTLETHIHRLRRKIECDPARPQLLVTELGGYRLMFANAGVDASGE